MTPSDSIRGSPLKVGLLSKTGKVDPANREQQTAYGQPDFFAKNTVIPKLNQDLIPLGCMSYGSSKRREWILDEEQSLPFLLGRTLQFHRPTTKFRYHGFRIIR